MTKVVRQLVWDGHTYEVRHALREDGSCPSLSAFTEMSEGRWEEDPDLQDVPDEAQIAHSDKFIAGIEFFAEYGYPNNRYCTVNALRGGVWEFKLGRKRVSFFDTDGRGGFLPKPKVRERTDSEFPDDDDFWWLPRFDENVRIGHCFGKNSQKTEADDLEESERVREEDVKHDRVE